MVAHIIDLSVAPFRLIMMVCNFPSTCLIFALRLLARCDFDGQIMADVALQENVETLCYPT